MFFSWECKIPCTVVGVDPVTTYILILLSGPPLFIHYQ